MAEKSEIQEEEMPSTSGLAKEKEVKELFDMKNFPHWLDSDEEDYDDYDETDREKDPEFFMTDEEVDQVFKEMSESDREIVSRNEGNTTKQITDKRGTSVPCRITSRR